MFQSFLYPKRHPRFCAVVRILHRAPEIIIRFVLSRRTHNARQHVLGFQVLLIAFAAHLIHPDAIKRIITRRPVGLARIAMPLVFRKEPDADFRECCRLGIKVIDDVLAHGLPHGTYLNLNVPVVERVKGLKVCHQADGRWIKEFKRSENASGHPVFWLTGEFRNDDSRADNDMLALDNGFATLVPCKVDVTDYQFLKELRKRTEE